MDPGRMVAQRDLDIFETERAIVLIKRFFEDSLANVLNLKRVSAPLFVDRNSGMQDNLNGFEKPVGFSIGSISGSQYEIVHSLAKWKRHALARYGVEAGAGIYTDMNAIRPDEESLLTGIHSVYVDQWDWEKAMNSSQRRLDYLMDTVRSIYDVIRNTDEMLCAEFGFTPFLPDSITFLHSEELLELYPELTPREREDRACREYGAIFVIGIGGELSDGSIHDGRAPDYDDWQTETGQGRRGLNGDIMVFNPVLQRGFELSSMGIRINAETLMRQLEIRDCVQRAELPWHQMLLGGQLPQSIGGGIGQSRLCMLLLGKRHIGEVQVSVWPEEVLVQCDNEGITLL
ncbi:MAG: aspartate--ammonia ligase [Candidatus Wallbacteria bacterium HGW-Wallbacteria-1]|uniref:Aspartate--ammonia ligase n=1 Tax=Candidatus Wallbacteria bacterium HGW-Wallbacteria-1 TaxID=2013854 RepID=A0A2N1PMA1_9BACT|nr:MAG: aspartate--ammonia ligase [Candidatus Wallbacteria bacterium HGW-Wallbacteria-1]